MYYKLGIEVGSTHTDAVLLDDSNNLLAAAKTPTTPDIGAGILASLDEVLHLSGADRCRIRFAMLGTTHCTNAILERRLAKTGLIRICRPAGGGVEPFHTWPAALRLAAGDCWRLVTGGYEYDGRPLAPLDEAEITRVLVEFRTEGVQSLAVCGISSPVRPDQEIAVARLARDTLGADFPVTLSHEIGRTGLLGRESAAVLNAALVRVMERVAMGMEQALRTRKIRAQLFFAQNNGTLMSLAYAKNYPIFTLGSGPASSARGAAFVTGVGDGVVVDVGGSSIDVVALTRGYPRQSTAPAEIGGIRINFRMPDVISLPVGGGSVVRFGDGGVTFGPEGVGPDLSRRALAWGGHTLTVTDVAVWLNHFNLGDPNCDPDRVTGLHQEAAKQVMDKLITQVEQAVERIKGQRDPVAVVMVGGGSALLPERLMGTSTVLRPRYYPFAGAIGVAIAQIGGEVDRLWSLDRHSRAEILAEATAMARERAVRAGADPATVTVLDVQEIPLTYLPSKVVRIHAKAAGSLCTS